MIRLVIYAFFLVGVLVGKGQVVTLADNLKKLQVLSGVTFNYDAELIENIALEDEVGSLERFWEVLEQSALGYEQISESEFLIVPKKTRISFSFISDEPKEVLQAFYIDIIRNGNEVLYQHFLSDPTIPVRFDWLPRPGDTISIVTTAYERLDLPANGLILRTSQDVALTEKVTYLDEIVIENYLAKGISLNVPDHSINIEMEKLALIPGETDGDVLASLATLPGINTPDTRPGNLFIRGSSSDQNLLLYNNIPIYHRGHYFGSISPYNPALINGISIYKNGYHPRRGGRTGGAIEIKSQGALSEYEGYGVGINSLYGNAFIKKRIGQKVGIAIAGRRSIPSSFRSPKLSEISEMVYSATAISDEQLGFDIDEVDVQYEDYNFDLTWRVNQNNRIKVGGLFISNFTGFENETSSAGTQQELAFDNKGLSFEWGTTIGSRFTGKFLAYYSDYFSEFNRENNNMVDSGLSSDEGTDNLVRDVAVTYETVYTTLEENQLNLGVTTQWMDVEYRYAERAPEQAPVDVADEDNAFVHSLFANYKYVGQNRIYFQLGGRTELFTKNSRVYFSPRLLMNYDLSNELILKGSAGRYYQYISQMKFLQFGNSGFDNELWWLAGNDNASVLRSDQLMLGSILTKGPFVFDLELYNKTIENVNYASTFRLQDDTEYAPAQWDVTGVDFFVKSQLSNGFSMWGSYEYTTHEVTFDSLESVAYTYKNNRPHRLKIGGLFQGGRWKVSYAFKVLSGMYGRSLDIIAELDKLSVSEDPPPPQPGMPPPPGGPPSTMTRPLTIEDLPERYPTFTGLDVFVSYYLPKTDSRKWDAKFGLSLINIFNVRNQIDTVVRGQSDNRILIDRYALGFAPNINVSVTW